MIGRGCRVARRDRRPRRARRRKRSAAGIGVDIARGPIRDRRAEPRATPHILSRGGSAAEAGKITVAPAQGVTGAGRQGQLGPPGTVSGIVVGADDVVPVMLMAEDAGGRGPLGGPTLTGRSQSDGTFSVTNVPPGRYVAVARSGGGREGGAEKRLQSTW